MYGAGYVRIYERRRLLVLHLLFTTRHSWHVEQIKLPNYVCAVLMGRCVCVSDQGVLGTRDARKFAV